MGKYLVIAALAVVGLFIFGFGGGKSSLVSYEELQAKLAKKENFVLLDVRTPEEFAEGHIGGSVLCLTIRWSKRQLAYCPIKINPLLFIVAVVAVVPLLQKA